MILIGKAFHCLNCLIVFSCFNTIFDQYSLKMDLKWFMECMWECNVFNTVFSVHVADSFNFCIQIMVKTNRLLFLNWKFKHISHVHFKRVTKKNVVFWSFYWFITHEINSDCEQIMNYHVGHCHSSIKRKYN